MGDVIKLSDHLAHKRSVHGPARPVAFHFDLASPFTYLAAERVERLFSGVAWRPAFADALHGGDPWPDADAWGRAAERAEARAQELGMPISWPEGGPPRGRAAMRTAAYAAEIGRAPAFVLAASRLAFCGGYDLDDPEVLAEAAAAAGLGLEDSLRAARDVARDGDMERAGLALLARGADGLPATRVGRVLFCGEERLSEALLASQAASPPRRRLPYAG
jgi:2-hydroxychromene-2-carboxylate isomerase